MVTCEQMDDHEHRWIELDVCDSWPSPAIEVCLICNEVRVMDEARADQRRPARVQDGELIEAA
jgi:hypothetical protein